MVKIHRFISDIRSSFRDLIHKEDMEEKYDVDIFNELVYGKEIMIIDKEDLQNIGLERMSQKLYPVNVPIRVPRYLSGHEIEKSEFETNIPKATLHTIKVLEIGFLATKPLIDTESWCPKCSKRFEDQPYRMQEFLIFQHHDRPVKDRLEYHYCKEVVPICKSCQLPIIKDVSAHLENPAEIVAAYA